MGQTINKEARNMATEINNSIDIEKASKVIGRTWRKLQRTRTVVKIIQSVAHFDDNVAKLICHHVMQTHKEFPSNTMARVGEKHISPLLLDCMGVGYMGRYTYSN